MTGADPGGGVAEVVAWNALPPTAAAIDAVYVPAETPFLSAARARAIRATGGVGWLVRQGALAFELWLGVPAPLGVMLAALRT
jgi:shikimate dehydrogenase